MYCSHCGKKVNDTMLFCPFCGDPIVIPEQDEPESAAPGVDSKPAVEAPEPAAAAPDVAPDATPETATVEPAPQGSSQPARAPLREMGEAEAELLDWNRSRAAYAHGDDVWANPSGSAEEFAPLSLEGEQEPQETEDWRREIAEKKEQAAPERKPPEIDRVDHEPVRLDGVAPRLDADIEGAKPVKHAREKARKPANTLVPPKAMDPNDIFMDGGDADFDEFDDFDSASGDGFPDADYVFEDADEGSFFMRHIRGIVGLALFVILILMFVIYAFSRAGQQSLARMNLAWSIDTYSQMGYEFYQQENYQQAGIYYERALQRDPMNYSYASSAAMAYVEAKNTEKAAEMLKRCAKINPTLLEPYIYLLNLYPDAAQRPWDVTQLLQQGYERTGDARLNVTG